MTAIQEKTDGCILATQHALEELTAHIEAYRALVEQIGKEIEDGGHQRPTAHVETEDCLGR